MYCTYMTETFTLTFVTHYLHDKQSSPKNDEWNIGRLMELVSIKIPLYIFVSPENADEIAFLHSYSHIYIEVVEKSDLWVFKQLKNTQYSLPQYRNVEKDTEDHLALSNSKVELVNRAIECNPWNTRHFAYVDFNITYLFWEKQKTYDYLKQMAKRDFFDKMIMFPGCSSQIDIEYISGLDDAIYWRFCGSFFVGDAESLKSWWILYRESFLKYLASSKKLTWDVNFWSWMETIERWEPRWYSANHNDSIVTAISADFITKNMLSVSRRVKHNYPIIPQFRPTSASYLKTLDGRRWLNTRFVNYWLYNNGCYGYPTNEHVIENRNMLCELDDDFVPIPGTFVEVESRIDLPKFSGTVISRGLEDIRLYYGCDMNDAPVVKCIATTVDLSPNGKNNMIVCNYDIENHRITDGQIVLAPNESWCEKNWIPIDGEKFIYKWSPMEIGKIKDGTLEIVLSYEINAPYFHKVRGSTTFIDHEEGLLGVVHFSEDHNPRHYYHILVLLEKETLRPLKYSNCFCFKSLGVEFCIGFTNELENEYTFWISQLDRDPMTVFISKTEIPLSFIF